MNGSTVTPKIKKGQKYLLDGRTYEVESVRKNKNPIPIPFKLGHIVTADFKVVTLITFDYDRMVDPTGKNDGEGFIVLPDGKRKYFLYRRIYDAFIEEMLEKGEMVLV